MTRARRIRHLLDQAITRQPKLERQLYLAGAISAGFEERGISAVLVGGTVVEFYTAGEYSTADIDMILPPLGSKEIGAIMEELGFVRAGIIVTGATPENPLPG